MFDELKNDFGLFLVMFGICSSIFGGMLAFFYFMHDLNPL